MAVSEAELVQYAESRKLHLGRSPKRRLRYWAELGLLPPRVAARNPQSKTIMWVYPDYAVRCIDVIGEYASYPHPEIAKILIPLMAQWQLQDQARRDTSVTATELHTIILAQEEVGGLSRLRDVCHQAGMPRQRFLSLMRRVVGEEQLTESEHWDVAFVLRKGAQHTEDLKRRALIFEAADRLERQLRAAEGVNDE